MSMTTVTPFGLQRMNRRGEHLFVVAADDEEARREVAMGHRDAGAGRRGDRTAHAGNHLVGDARALERLRLLAAATEHERIAALQPDDPSSAFCLADQHRLDFVLRQRVAPCALADVEPLRTPSPGRTTRSSTSAS